MAAFALDGETYGYQTPGGGDPEQIHSWAYGAYPKIRAALPLTKGGTVTVYGHAQRWSPTHILIAWTDDTGHAPWAWVPAGNVERVTDSEWDIEEYRRCPDHLRGIRWGSRLPGFLPE